MNHLGQPRKHILIQGCQMYVPQCSKPALLAGDDDGDNHHKGGDEDDLSRSLLPTVPFYVSEEDVERLPWMVGGLTVNSPHMFTWMSELDRDIVDAADNFCL